MAELDPRGFLRVTQSRTGLLVGDCYAASIASILCVPLGSVPPLTAGEGPEAGHWDHAAVRRLWRWILSTGHVLLKGHFAPRPLPIHPPDAFPGHGYLPWDRPYILCGDNPDGVSHACVASFGEVAWDPNPSRRGLVSADGAEIIVQLEWALETYAEEVHGLIREHGALELPFETAEAPCPST